MIQRAVRPELVEGSREKLFQIHHLCFRFSKSASDFFHQIDLHINKPGITFVTGKNGVGKTTFFSILLDQIPATSVLRGEVKTSRYNYDIASSSDRAKLSHNIGFVHQHVGKMLADQFTALQNLQAAQLASYPGLNNLPEAPQAQELARKLHIPLGTAVHNLSGGQKQALAIAMALQHDVELLLLDEPTASLDDANSEKILSLVRDLSIEKNIPVLCISHDPDLVARFNNGNIIVIEQHDGKRTIEMRNI